MLDFYLTNAPLHLSAQADGNDTLTDWRVRCTINGQSFVFDQWQPIYLKGFKPGRNWLQLELIDAQGQAIDNPFNNTVRTIDYQPGGEDTLAKLVRGELGLEQVLGIVDPTYTPPLPAEPEVVEPEDVAPAVVLPETTVAEEETPEALTGVELQTEAVETLPQGDEQDDYGAAVPNSSPENPESPSLDGAVNAAPLEPEGELTQPAAIAPESAVVPLSPSPTLPEIREESLTESTPATTAPEPELEATTAEPPPLPGALESESAPELAPELVQPAVPGWRQGWAGRRRSSQPPTYAGPRDHSRNQPRVAPERLDPETSLAPTLPSPELEVEPTPEETSPGEVERTPSLAPPVVNLEQPYI
jgi:hypothetical protein